MTIEASTNALAIVLAILIYNLPCNSLITWTPRPPHTTPEVAVAPIQFRRAIDGILGSIDPPREISVIGVDVVKLGCRAGRSAYQCQCNDQCVLHRGNLLVGPRLDLFESGIRALFIDRTGLCAADAYCSNDLIAHLDRYSTGKAQKIGIRRDLGGE